MIRVRVDDFPNTKDEEKDRHTLAAFREFHRCLSECIGGRRYLLGVIPKRCDPDDILFLRNETDCVIGMHGTDHDEERLDRNGGSQFENYLTTLDIHRQLREHKLALEVAVGRPVRIYMPPRNVLNVASLAAITLDGLFDWFTGGPETHQVFQDDEFCITSLPPTAYGRTDEMLVNSGLQRLLAGCEAGRDFVLTLHWTWETNIGLQHMRRFFEGIPKKHFKDFDD